MKRTVLAIVVCAGSLVSAGAAYAAGQEAPAPASAAPQQEPMENGSQQGGHAHAKVVPPLSQHEVGMLFNACIAYPECKTAYSKAVEHYQALQKQKREQQSSGTSGH